MDALAAHASVALVEVDVHGEWLGGGTVAGDAELDAARVPARAENSSIVYAAPEIRDLLLALLANSPEPITSVAGDSFIGATVLATFLSSHRRRRFMGIDTRMNMKTMILE